MLQRLVDGAAVAAEIERMRSLSGDALRRCWTSAFGRPLPRSLTVELLRRMPATSSPGMLFGTLSTWSLYGLIWPKDGCASIAWPQRRR
jgi:hypothetical protein